MMYANEQERPLTRRFLGWATVVLLLAALLRLLVLQDVPPGLAQDEVLNADIVTFIRQGYHALFFREGYGHEPLHHYWSVPFQVLLGHNVLSVRLPAVCLGLLLVAATMRWAKREFGEETAVVAGFGLAVSWWPLIFSRIGLRRIMEPLFLVLAAWYWPRRPWLAGLFFGLSIYTYTGARYIFLIPLALTLYLLLRRRALSPSARFSWRRALLVFLIAFACYLPLAWTLHADPSLQQRVDQLSGPLDALRMGDVRPILETILATIGVFSFTGDPRWTYTLPGRPFFDPFTAIFFYLGLLLALWRWREPIYAFLLIWLGVALLPSAVTPDAPSTVRLVGAMPVVYVLPGLAAAEMRKRLKGKRLPFALVMAVLLLLNLGLTWRDGFVRWPQAEETRLKYQTVLLEIGRHWQADPVPRLVLADAFFEPIDADSFRRDLGYDAGARWVQLGTAVAGAIVLPGGDGNGRLYIPEFAAPPESLLTAAGIARRPLWRSEAVPSFAVYALPDTVPTPAQPLPVTLDGQITLLGYEVLEAVAGRSLRLVTYWRVESPLPADLAAFAHLLVDGTTIVAQHDGFDAASATLQAGDVVVQYHILPLPDTLPTVPMTLQVGLYERGNGRRLLQGNGADSIILQTDVLFD
ncbi:MAG: glycosyltransferase family 39 protein [Anaerolineales bacterium]|nr:glycosyltransferase family 39 protein [Anaerolineales bacterium]